MTCSACIRHSGQCHGEPGDTPDALTQDGARNHVNLTPPEIADTAQSAETTEAPLRMPKTML